MKTSIRRDNVPNGEYLTVFLSDDDKELGLLRIVLTNTKQAIFKHMFLYDMTDIDFYEKCQTQLLKAAVDEIKTNFSDFVINIGSMQCKLC